MRQVPARFPEPLWFHPEQPRVFSALLLLAQQHRHSGIRLLTPEIVHYGQADDVFQKSQLVLDAAYSAPGTLRPEASIALSTSSATTRCPLSL